MTQAAVESYEITERFDRTLKLLRGALAETDLEIAAEFDGGGRTLLVDSPLLSFEALALDRAAAVFFPLHVVVTAAGERTRIAIVDISHVVHARLPAGAEEPIERLAARIRMAVESVSRKTAPARADGGLQG